MVANGLADVLIWLGRQYSRLVGAIKGGGPTITVRATRGNLELMSRDEKAQREKADAGPEK